MRDLGELRHNKPEGSTGEIYASAEIGGVLWLFAYATNAAIWKYDGDTFEPVEFPGNDKNWRCRGVAASGTDVWLSGAYAGYTSQIVLWDTVAEEATVTDGVSAREIECLHHGGGVLYAAESGADPAVNPATVHALHPADLSPQWSAVLSLIGGVRSMLMRAGELIVHVVGGRCTYIIALDPSTGSQVWAHGWARDLSPSARGALVEHAGSCWLFTDDTVGAIVGRVVAGAIVTAQDQWLSAAPVSHAGSLYFARDSDVWRVS